ncbi:hypothetical protein [Promicromonospora sp. NPDC050262]|uniref:hypothetical protein n=1 Tax=Promicromonospora sp. NPDC050262 TaxID=3155036 RepID=UPI0033F07557
MSQTEQVARVHWPLNDGRAACMSGPAEPLPPKQAEAMPFCGACLAVLTFVGVHGEFWGDGSCLPPSERPTEALARLRDTPWANMFDTFAPKWPNTWWFENKEGDK